MSLPPISIKQRLKAKSNRLASQFAKRLFDKGMLLDRTKKEIGVKNPKVVQVKI